MSSSPELITRHNAGFFSCCSVRLAEIIRFFNTHKRFPNLVDSSAQFSAYKLNNYNNIENTCDTLFSTNYDITIPYTRDITFTDCTQYDEYKTIDFTGIKPFIDRYFRPTEYTQNNIRNLENRYQIKYYETIAVYYRGNDKVTETGIGSYDFFINKCRDLREKYPNHRFLVQTDELQFRDTFISNFNNSFYISELPVIPKNTSIAVHHVLNNTDRPKFGLNIISVSNIIAKCYAIVTHTGNCGLWSNLLRGNAENTFQFRRANNNDYWVQ